MEADIRRTKQGLEQNPVAHYMSEKEEKKFSIASEKCYPLKIMKINLKPIL